MLFITGRVNKQVQHYNKRLKKRSFGEEELSLFLGLLFSLSWTSCM